MYHHSYMYITDEKIFIKKKDTKLRCKKYRNKMEKRVPSLTEGGGGVKSIVLRARRILQWGNHLVTTAVGRRISAG